MCRSALNVSDSGQTADVRRTGHGDRRFTAASRYLPECHRRAVAVPERGHRVRVRGAGPAVQAGGTDDSPGRDGGGRVGWPSVDVSCRAALRWAAVHDARMPLPPQLEDPFEPLLLMFERGGGFTTEHGFIDLGGSSILRKGGGITRRSTRLSPSTRPRWTRWTGLRRPRVRNGRVKGCRPRSSISTKSSGRTRALTWTRVLAGGASPKYLLRTSFTAARSSIRVRKPVIDPGEEAGLDPGEEAGHRSG